METKPEQEAGEVPEDKTGGKTIQGPKCSREEMKTMMEKVTISRSKWRKYIKKSFWMKTEQT